MPAPSSSASCGICGRNRTPIYPLFYSDSPRPPIPSGISACQGCLEEQSLFDPCTDCGERILPIDRIGPSGSMVVGRGGVTMRFKCHRCVSRLDACLRCGSVCEADTLVDCPPPLVNRRLRAGVPSSRRSATKICPACYGRIRRCAGCDAAGFQDDGRSRMVRGASHWMCSDCIHFLVQCGQCSDHFDTRNISMRQLPDGQRVCPDCSSHLQWFNCSRCSQNHLQRTALFFPENPEVFYCRLCYERASRNRVTDEQLALGTIFNYTLKAPEALSFSIPPKKLLFGMELEVVTGGSYQESAARVYAAANRKVICKSDSSISAGYEIVSVPLVLDEAKQLVTNILATNGSRPQTQHMHEHSSCGMHVHVSRSVLKRSQIAKMLLFVHSADNASFITHIARRPPNRYTGLVARRWKDPGILGGEHLDRHDQSMRVRSPATNQLEVWLSPGRYQALNLCNPHTVEFRMFAATVDANIACMNLEFCHALVAFLAPATLPLRDARSVPAFLAFVRDNKAVYPNLVKYLEGYEWKGPATKRPRKSNATVVPDVSANESDTAEASPRVPRRTASSLSWQNGGFYTTLTRS